MKRLRSRLSLSASLVFLLISVEARKLGERLARKRDKLFSYWLCNSIFR
jgi:hypothetical protein